MVVKVSLPLGFLSLSAAEGFHLWFQIWAPPAGLGWWRLEVRGDARGARRAVSAGWQAWGSLFPGGGGLRLGLGASGGPGG